VRQIPQVALTPVRHDGADDFKDRNALPPPDLWDARLVEPAGDGWIVTGFERIDDDLTATDYAQAWVLMQPREATNGFHGSETI
jgi:hypothetical protein